MLRDSYEDKRLGVLEQRIEGFETLSREREERNKERLVEIKSAIAAALASADKANVKAESATDKRFDLLNELRALVNDNQATLLPRKEFGVQYQALIDLLNVVDKRMDTLETRVLNTQTATESRDKGIGLVGRVVISALGALVALTSLATFWELRGHDAETKVEIGKH